MRRATLLIGVLALAACNASNIPVVGTLAAPHQLSLNGSPQIKGTIFVAQGGRIWRVRSSGVDSLTGSSGSLAYPAVSADGSVTAAALISMGHSEIALGDKNFNNLKRLTTPARDRANAVINVKPAVSPDGKRLAFLSDRCGDCQELALYENAIGFTARRISFPQDFSGGEDFPTYALDGSGLTYVSWRQDQTLIERLTPPSTSPRRLFVPDKGEALDPMVGPDGRIAFAQRTSGVSNIVVTAIDGSGEISLTGFGDCRQPSWSPDGRTIAFISQHDGTFDLWRVPVAGGTPERLTLGADLDANSRPIWISGS